MSAVKRDRSDKLVPMAEITRRTVLLSCAASAVLPQAKGAKVNVDELSTMDATGLAELVRKGKVSALELVEAATRRIEALNPRINAVIWERFEKARQEARGALPKGPFTGESGPRCQDQFPPAIRLRIGGSDLSANILAPTAAITTTVCLYTKAAVCPAPQTSASHSGCR
jgi:hypothetical protein